jgi:hypothetical protein
MTAHQPTGRTGPEGPGGPGGPEGPEAPGVPDDEVFLAPPSFAQERLWFLQTLDGSAAYNVGVGFRLTGRYDHAALERALTELVRRHETLRTTLGTHEDELTQFIAPPHRVELAVEDVSGAPDPAAAVRERAAAELAAPFDSAAGPVYRTALLKAGPDEHVLLLVLDHLVCDAWSLRVLHRDVVACYTAAVEGTPMPPEPAVQYADYAQWQRDWLEAGELERQIAYWRERLADPPAKIRPPLPALPGPAVDGTVEQPLAPELAEALAARGRERNASLFMVVTAAFAALLARYSGARDVVFGTLMANRNQPETEDLVGFFTNTGALRFDLSGRPTVAELIDRGREVALGAYAHQDVPFHRLVEELRPPREAGEAPYFDVLIQLADVDRPVAEVAGTRVEPVPLDSRPAPMDVVVTLLKQDGGHTLVWDHHGERVDAASAARMAEHFGRMLTAFATGPADAEVAGVEIYDPDEPHGWPRPAARPEPGATTPSAEAARSDEPGQAADSAAGAGDDAEPGTSDAAAEPAGSDPGATSGEPESPLLAQVLGAIAEVWAEVLGYEPAELAPQDDFFDLGGHSLAAGRVVNRLNRRGFTGLPVRLIFDHPVLADLAAAAAEYADPGIQAPASVLSGTVAG